MPADGLSDIQLLALGRFTWAGMRLETQMAKVCEILSAGVTKVGTTGTWVKKVRKALPTPDPLQARSIDWLEQAFRVLDETRNAILHARLEAWYVGEAPAPDSMWEWQHILANRRRGSSIDFTPEALAIQQDRLDYVRAIGNGIDADLSAIRNRG